MYKNLRISLGGMSFPKDFVSTSCGDPYPILAKSEDCLESVAENRYTVKRGSVRRLLCRFFPFASYELSYASLEGEVGIGFRLGESEALIAVKGDRVVYTSADRSESSALPAPVGEVETMIVTCRPGAFDLYFKDGDVVRHHHTFKVEAFELSHAYKAFSRGYVGVVIDGEATIRRAEGYIDNGISLADLRSIRYENGEVMVENGKVYLTASIRMHEGSFQGVFSWLPGTPELNLVGAIFYDAGDGLWCGDVAASILYHRENKRWMLWVCSFSHGHILGHAQFDGDVRFGVNVLDITLMEKMDDGNENTFYGKMSDEDPDFIYDEKSGKWYMSICRAVTGHDSREYHYFFFESDNAFSGYKFIGRTSCGGAETGGSLLMLDGRLVFACGACFDKRAEYRIYDLFDTDHCTRMRFDYDDGGFRGWGTIIPIKYGNRKRYFHLTFDRSGGSDYTWSYGNIYCFELIEE
jgi:hypothetical protein